MIANALRHRPRRARPPRAGVAPEISHCAVNHSGLIEGRPPVVLELILWGGTHDRSDASSPRRLAFGRTMAGGSLAGKLSAKASSSASSRRCRSRDRCSEGGGRVSGRVVMARRLRHLWTTHDLRGWRDAEGVPTRRSASGAEPRVRSAGSHLVRRPTRDKAQGLFEPAGVTLDNARVAITSCHDIYRLAFPTTRTGCS